MPSSEETRSQDERLTPEAFWRWVWISVRPYLGHAFVALGLVLLIVAYFGVSREIYVARQVPYIVSGGLFGLAAITFGSRLMLIEDLRRDAGRLQRLESSVAELHAALLSRPDAPGISSISNNGNGSHALETTGVIGKPVTDRVVVLSGGQTFHRASCSMVRGKSGTTPTSTASAQGKGLAPCKLCQPLAVGV